MVISSKRAIWVFVGLMAASHSFPDSIRANETVTLVSLLGEMQDREALAQWPQPRYTCRQASSYDRRSTDPADPASWFANADRSQWVRVEENQIDGHVRREFVMMDEAGPGAIVRFWGTWHGPQGGPFSNGILRVYLDESSQPAIEGTIQQVLDEGLLTSGPLAEGVSPDTPYAQRGHNLYLPIPYARHCKVTYSTDVLVDQGAVQGEAVYYQINYRTYEPGTQVETFSMNGLKSAADAIALTQQAILQAPKLDGCDRESLKTVIPPGKSATIRLKGANAIRALSVQLATDDLSQAWRSVVLKAEFDGEPCVWVPVGEFFGVGYHASSYSTFYSEATDDGQLHSWWVMPFAREAILTLENLGDQPVQLQDFSIDYVPWQWDQRSMHFHATWHELYKVETRRGSKQPGDGAFNVNYVTVDGQGVYVGDTLSVFNGAAAWWGEGDETIYVDGESFPSHFGTGTEDYYGYAWCRPEKFASPFHAQPTGAGNLAGGFSVNSRYRALDAIPFRTSIKFDMELWHWADTKMNFAPTAFYYARPSSRHNVAPDPLAVKRPVTRSRAEMGTIYAVPDAIEGEQLKVAMVSGGEIESQTSGNWGWSNEQQLWWRDGAVGDQLVLDFPVESAGEYNVTAHLTKAPDYAQVTITVNDSQEELVVDGYHPAVATHTVELGSRKLEQGVNQLKVRITGHNASAITRGMFGLDYLHLIPATPTE